MFLRAGPRWRADTGSNHLLPLEGKQMANGHPSTWVSLEQYLEGKYIPEPNSGCWLWLGRPNSDGYGVATWRGKSEGAHRKSWTHYRGPIPAGMLVLHKCDNRACMNPDHLFLGSNADNAADRDAKGRQSRGRDHGDTFRDSPKFLASRPRGEMHVNAKLTAEQVREMRNAQGSLQQIASRYGVHKTLVGQIKKGKAWAHV